VEKSKRAKDGRGKSRRKRRQKKEQRHGSEDRHYRGEKQKGGLKSRPYTWKGRARPGVTALCNPPKHVAMIFHGCFEVMVRDPYSGFSETRTSVLL